MVETITLLMKTMIFTHEMMGFSGELMVFDGKSIMVDACMIRACPSHLVATMVVTHLPHQWL